MMMESVRRLRNKTWFALTGSLTLLIVTALMVASLLINQQTQNSIYEALHNSLITNGFYVSEVTAPPPLNTVFNLHSDVALDTEQIESLFPILGNANKNYALIPSGEHWFYVTGMESGERVVLVDVSEIIGHQNRVFTGLIAGGIAGLLTIVAGSFLIANGLIKPTRMTVEMQKEMTLLKKRFTANASHELRTPLTMIKGGFDEVLTHKEETVEAQFKWFEMIGTGINRIDVLANELSILADLEDEGVAVTRDLINVSQHIERLIVPWKKMANDRGLQLDLMIEPNLSINTHAEKLEQLLSIFLSNAFEYVNENGHIEIKLAGTQKQVQISITNSGAGIPEEELSKIFEHFHRVGIANVKSSGSGLGLTIAKKIADQLGGKVNVQSVVDESTLVELTI